MIDDVTNYDAVEGYCSPLSCAAGDELVLHVSCRTARYDIEIHRWGSTRDLVWSRQAVPGVQHPTRHNASGRGCDWPAAVSLTVPTEWRSGFYHVTLTAHDAPAERSAGHACFVVRAAHRAADLLLVLATNTYNAYNSWGGKSLYTGGTSVSFRRPFGRGIIVRPDAERDDRKARPTRWGEEPDIDGLIYQQYRSDHAFPGFMGSTGWFTYERRFVEWAEAEGFTIDVAISSDLADDPSIVDGYPLVLGVGHDEYWSGAQRDTIEAHVRRGGNYASFSGNTMFWQVRLIDGGDTMVCYKYRAHTDDPIMTGGDPTAMTGMWCDPIVGRPETALLGAGSAWGLYNRFGKATARGSGAFTVYRDRHWLLEGTGLRYGDLLGARDGVVGYETVGCRLTFDDRQLPIGRGDDGAPHDLEIVAFTPSSNLAVGEYPASIAALDDQGDLEFIAARLYGDTEPDTLDRCRFGNAVMLVCQPFGASGGEVVTVGTTDWIFGLAGDPAVARVTRNVLERYSATT